MTQSVEFMCVTAECVTSFPNLYVGLSSPIAVFRITGIITQICLLQWVYGQSNGHFLFTQVFSDGPGGEKETMSYCSPWVVESKFFN